MKLIKIFAIVTMLVTAAIGQSGDSQAKADAIAGQSCQSRQRQSSAGGAISHNGRPVRVHQIIAW